MKKLHHSVWFQIKLQLCILLFCKNFARQRGAVLLWLYQFAFGCKPDLSSVIEQINQFKLYKLIFYFKKSNSYFQTKGKWKYSFLNSFSLKILFQSEQIWQSWVMTTSILNLATFQPELKYLLIISSFILFLYIFFLILD